MASAGFLSIHAHKQKRHVKQGINSLPGPEPNHDRETEAFPGNRGSETEEYQSSNSMHCINRGGNFLQID